MTQILNLPRLDGSQSRFTVAKNAGWYDAISFASPLSPPLSTAAGAIVNGSVTVTLATAIVAALAVGQPVVGIGIPTGTTVAAIPTATTITLSNAATALDVAAALTFQPIPLDLTGIAFRAMARAKVTDDVAIMDMSTADFVLATGGFGNGQLINGGASGVLGFKVPPTDANLARLQATGGVIDILAAADGYLVNLFQNGPASLTVNPGVVR